METAEVGRQYICALAGPLVGWITLCAVLARPELLMLGTIVGLPFIYLFGLPVVVPIYCLDRGMINRSLPLWFRSVTSLVLGAVLSIILFRFVRLPMDLHGPGLLLGSLPGAVAGFMCTCWGGR
jgi:hypothetical protein